MDKAKACEILRISDLQLDRFVKLNRVALRDGDNDDLDAEHLRQQAQLNPGVPLSKLPAKRSF